MDSEETFGVDLVFGVGRLGDEGRHVGGVDSPISMKRV